MPQKAGPEPLARALSAGDRAKNPVAARPEVDETPLATGRGNATQNNVEAAGSRSAAF